MIDAEVEEKAVLKLSHEQRNEDNLLETEKGKERILTRNKAALQTYFRILTSRIERLKISVILSHSMCNNLSQKQQETKTLLGGLRLHAELYSCRSAFEVLLSHLLPPEDISTHNPCHHLSLHLILSSI